VLDGAALIAEAGRTLSEAQRQGGNRVSHASRFA